MNALNVISPYKHLGVWVFDDPRVGLVQEPFVAGADTMIDRVGWLCPVLLKYIAGAPKQTYIQVRPRS